MNLRLLPRLRGLLDELADRLEARRAWSLAGLSILYLSVTGLVASYRPLWNDELYTLYIARLPGLSDVWAALSTGAEQTPPFFYVLTRASLALFGQSELSLRLPAVAGFWIMALCLFCFVSNRASALYGFVAMLFPLVTGSYYYASEARPYGLVLGFSGVALLCWQAATNDEGRLLPTAGLGVSLAAAVSCHYQAIFVLLPLALAEAVRSLILRRVALRIWAALALSVAPLLGFLPLIERAASYSSTFWAKPRWALIPEFYYSLLAPSVMALLALLVLSALYPATARSRHHPATHPPAPRPQELAAAFGFMAIPIVAVVLSMLATGAFTDRYALPAVLGGSLLVAFSARWSSYDRPAITAILILALCASFVSLGVKSLVTIATMREAQAHTIAFLRSEGMSELPIAVSDQHAFVSLAHYAPRDIASRLVYLADPAKALTYLGHNSVERGALDLLKPWFHLPIEDYRAYIASRHRFLVYGSPGHFLNWLLSDLTTSRRTIELRGRDHASLLFLVSLTRPPDTARLSGEPEDVRHRQTQR